MSKTRSRPVKAAALLLILTFAASLLLPLSAAHAEDAVRTLHIGSKAELLTFAKNCTLDSYSKGLDVYLDADIELSSQSFAPIPIFFGHFDGQGHTISGLNIEAKGSSMGLFRTLEYGGSVRRLTVSGSASPTGTACSVGLICGINYGVISNCTTAGAVRGVTGVGGIAGVNAEGGVIGGCVNNASITGGSDTGGIAGANEGTIDNCTNAGGVNTTGEIIKTDLDASQLTDLTMSLAEGALDTSQSSSDTEEQDVSIDAPRNTGGIAGKSSGVLRGCDNEGAVGYMHLGYNTGGIVGKQDGIVADCENRGSILGRKDVGGIVGQFEPDIAINYDRDKRDLEDEINKLSEILRTLANTVGSSADSMLTDADTINSAVDAIESSIKDTADEGSPQLQTSLTEVYNSLQIISSSAVSINNAISDYTAQFNRQSEIIMAAMNRINTALEEMDISPNIAVISQQLAQINTALGNISAAVGDLESLITTVSGILQDSTLTPVQQQTQILEALRVFAAAIDANSIRDNLDIIVASADRINSEISAINQKLSTGTQTIVEQLRVITQAADALRVYTTRFSEAVTADSYVINRELDDIEDTVYNYGSAAIDRWDKTFDTVYGQLNIINGSLENIIAAGKDANTAVNGLINSAIDQFQVVGETVSNLLEKPQYTAVDVSDSIDDVEKPGQVSGCRNVGAVDADVNVGGIAGIMAMEVGNDPETDFDMSGGLWTDTTALFRAIVMHGSNTGSVNSKNGNVGGIVGRGDIGALYQMYNVGNVSGSDSLCGGLAGSSGGSIITCFAMCSLTGTDEVGGCAGSAHNISHCRTMVTINGDGEKHGAVAGTANGEILDNVFVLETLAGIDGISYDGKAYGLPYTDFVALPDMPAFFGSLYIDFVKDGALIKRVSVEYGGDLDEGSAPPIPSREDSYGVWDDYVSDKIVRNQVVNAKYLPWEKTVASDGDLPQMLAEGQFSDQARLTLSVSDKTASAGFLERPILALDYSVSDPKMPSQDEVKLHVRLPGDGDYAVYVQSGSAIAPVETSIDGSYLVFTAPLRGSVFVVRTYLRLAIIAAAGLLLLILTIVSVVLLVRRRRRKSGSASQCAAAEAVENTEGVGQMADLGSVPEAAAPENAKRKKRAKGAHQK